MGKSGMASGVMPRGPARAKVVVQCEGMGLNSFLSFSPIVRSCPIHGKSYHRRVKFVETEENDQLIPRSGKKREESGVVDSIAGSALVDDHQMFVEYLFRSRICNYPAIRIASAAPSQVPRTLLCHSQPSAPVTKTKILFRVGHADIGAMLVEFKSAGHVLPGLR